MECNQKQTTVAATKTLCENFLEEKCECDLIVPDYFPAAEKVIQCSAWPTISKKIVEGDRLILEGNCRFSVIYQSEDDCGIKSLSENVNFSESFPLKDVGKEPWVQTVVRLSGNSCRLLNGRKINAKANISIAIKVKDQHHIALIEKTDCKEVETLFKTEEVHTILEHPSDSFKVQGEIEVHTDIQDVLKTEGVVCIKDIKVMPGKAIVKGILDLYVLFTSEEDPCRVEHTSTAIPFSQTIEMNISNEEILMDLEATIQNVRTDVESDDAGKNRIISVVATILAEGETFLNKQHQFLIDAYSNSFTMESERREILTEKMIERGRLEESMVFEFPLDGEEVEVIQSIGTPVIRKITGSDNTLVIEGILDLSLFIREGEQYRSVDKSFPFTLKKPMDRLEGQMRCEVTPSLIGTDCSINGDMAKIKAEINCMISVFSKRSANVIQSFELDNEHCLPSSGSSSVIVYFAERGERLWDIARKYATSVATIRGLNELDDDVLKDRRMLLISR